MNKIILFACMSIWGYTASLPAQTGGISCSKARNVVALNQAIIQDYRVNNSEIWFRFKAGSNLTNIVTAKPEKSFHIPIAQIKELSLYSGTCGSLSLIAKQTILNPNSDSLPVIGLTNLIPASEYFVKISVFPSNLSRYFGFYIQSLGPQPLPTVCNATTCSNNLTVNGNFELGNQPPSISGFSTQYQYFATGSASPGRIFITTNPFTLNANWAGSNHTPGGQWFLVCDGANFTDAIWQQSISVCQNTNYIFSFWVNNLNRPGSNLLNPTVVIRINGVVVNTPSPTIVPETPDAWIQICGVWNSGANTTATLRISIEPTTLPGGFDLGIDDIEFFQMDPFANTSIIPANPQVCLGRNTTLTVTGLPPGANVLWSTGATGPSITVSPVVNTNYTATVTVCNCSKVLSTTVTVTTGCCTPANKIISGSNSLTEFGANATVTIPIIDISGTFLVNSNLTFSGCDVRMAPNARIDVANNVTLTITNSGANPSRLYSCTDMWYGIDLSAGPNAVLIVNGNSSIEDAFNSVVSRNNGGFYNLNNARLNKNLKHIVVENYTGTYPGTIRNTRFTCQTSVTSTGNLLKTPHTTDRTVIGIEIINVFLINIGTPQVPVSLTRNTFSNCDYGIRSTNASLVIKNNRFLNLTPPIGTPCPPFGACPGTAIWATGSNTRVNQLFVGGGPQNFHFNSFDNCSGGVFAEFNMNVDIISNSFTGIIEGVRVLSCGQRNINITTNNQFRNCALGIHCADNAFAIIKILGNRLQQSPSGIGILVEEPVLTTETALIQNNLVDNYRTGIWAINIRDRLNILTNTIDNIPAPPGSNIAYGIRLQGCRVYNVDQNIINAPALPLISQPVKKQGISLEISVGSIRNNLITRMSTGIRCFGNNNPMVIKCNVMTNCQRGVMLDATDIGDQGSLFAPSDNQWVDQSGFFPQFDILEISITQPNNWIVRNSPSQYLPSPLNVNNTIIIPISNAPITTCSPPCTTALCRQRLLAEIVQGNAQLNSFAQENRFFRSDMVFSELESAPTLMSLGTPDDTVLRNFHDSIKNTNIAKLKDVNTLINNGNYTQAQTNNSQILPQCKIEKNHTNVNSAYLSGIADGNGFSFQQLNELDSIAKLCPLTGGRAVYGARVLMNIVMPVSRDYEDSCSAKTQRNTDRAEISFIDEKHSNIFKLYPTPNNGDMHIDYFISNDEEGKVLVVDLTGKKVSEYKLLSNVQTLHVSEPTLENGIYFYQVVINGVVITSEKIIIIK